MSKRPAQRASIFTHLGAPQRATPAARFAPLQTLHLGDDAPIFPIEALPTAQLTASYGALVNRLRSGLEAIKEIEETAVYVTAVFDLLQREL